MAIHPAKSKEDQLTFFLFTRRTRKSRCKCERSASNFAKSALIVRVFGVFWQTSTNRGIKRAFFDHASTESNSPFKWIVWNTMDSIFQLSSIESGWNTIDSTLIHCILVKSWPHLASKRWTGKLMAIQLQSWKEVHAQYTLCMHQTCPPLTGNSYPQHETRNACAAGVIVFSISVLCLCTDHAHWACDLLLLVDFKLWGAASSVCY